MEHLLEYQDYLLAYRLRAEVGGKLMPNEPELAVPRYAALRVERQALARAVVGAGPYQERMRRVDALTDRLNFGFWHNPTETVTVLRGVIEAGGCRALEDAEGFLETLLTRAERARLTDTDARRVPAYYLGLVRASVAYLDPDVFTRMRADVEPLRASLPVFVLP